MTPLPEAAMASDAASNGGQGRGEPPAQSKRMAKHLAKTRFCKHQLRGYCRYEDQCAYAHSTEELLPRPNFLKTKVCVNFLAGTCSNHQCTYAHGLTELMPRYSREGRLNLPGSSQQSVISDSACSGSTAAVTAVTDPGPLSSLLSLGMPQRHLQMPSRSGSRPNALEPEPHMLNLRQQEAEAIPLSVQQAAQQAAEEAARKVLVEGAALWRRAQEGSPAASPAERLLQQTQGRRETLLQQQQQQLQQLQLQQLQRQQQLLQQQQQLKQPQRRQQLPTDDWALMRAVLVEAVQMAASPNPCLEIEQAEHGKASRLWGRICRLALAAQSRNSLLEGRCLLHSERHGFVPGGEHLAVSLLLKEPHWARLFPLLARRCSELAAERLRPYLASAEAAAAGLGAPPPSPALLHVARLHAQRLGWAEEERSPSGPAALALPASSLGGARPAAAAARDCSVDLLPPPPGLGEAFGSGYSHPAQSADKQELCML